MTVAEEVKLIHEAATSGYHQGFNIRPAINKVPICLDKGTSLDKITTTLEQIEEWKKPNIKLEQWQINFFKTECEATDQQIENIKNFGYFANGFDIKMGKLRNGKYATLFDFDSEQSLKDFLTGRNNKKTTLKELSKSYYIEHHTEPYFKNHLIVISNKDEAFGHLNENDKLGTDNKIGLGIDPKGWCATAPSKYMNTPYQYTKIEGGIDIENSKTINTTPNTTGFTEFADLYDRVTYVQLIHIKRYKEDQICKALEPHLNAVGGRHHTLLYFIGMLCKDTKKTEKEIQDLVTKICKRFNDEQLNDRLKCIETTQNLIKEGREEEVLGYKGLETIMEKKSIEKLKMLVEVVDKKSSNNMNDDEGKRKKKKTSQLEIIDEILADSGEQFTFFKDQFGVYYTRVNNKEIIELDTKDSDGRIYEYLRSLCRRSEDYPNFRPSVEALNTIIKDFRVDCTESKTVHNLNVRIARDPDNEYILHYDLIDEEFNIVTLTPDGWAINNNAPPIFKRHIGLNAKQVQPVKHDNNVNIFHSIFDKLISTNDPELKHVLKVYTIAAYIADIQKPILTVVSDQDSGKTTLASTIQDLVDPTTSRNLKISDSRENSQTFAQMYYIFYDNLTKPITNGQYQDLCLGVTGGSDKKKKLYTDAGNYVFQFDKRAISYTSIKIRCNEADLLDRSLLITDLEPIDANTRLKESQIIKEYNKSKPHILGYIFDILSKVLKLKQQGKVLTCVDKNHRLSDFAEYGELISITMGYEEGYFSKLYDNIQAKRIEEAIFSSVIGRGLMEFMHNTPYQKLEPTTLQQEIKLAVQTLQEEDQREEQEGEDDLSTNNYYIPYDIRTFMKEVYKLRPLLKMHGIVITKLPSSNGKRFLEIENLRLKKKG